VPVRLAAPDVEGAITGSQPDLALRAAGGARELRNAIEPALAGVFLSPLWGASRGTNSEEPAAAWCSNGFTLR